MWRSLLLLVTLGVLSGCAQSIRDTYNEITVATGCHLPREAAAEDCRRLAAQGQDQHSP